MSIILRDTRGFHPSAVGVRYREMGEGRNRGLFVAVVVSLAVSLGVGAGLMSRPSMDSPPTTLPTNSSAVELIEVHVAGWVVAPGVVSVESGSIVADAVDAAGGMRPGAISGSINLAAEVFPGEQVVVPGPVEGRTAQETGQSGGLITLNRANAPELEELPGVGPVLAARIVSYRDEHGRFETVEDLLEVPGIGEAKLSSIRDLVRP